MSTPVFGLSENDLRRVARTVRRTEGAVQNRPASRPAYPRAPSLPVMHLTTGPGGIPPKIGDVMGVADCTVRDIVSADGRTLSTTSRTMPVRNPATTAVGGNKAIAACWDSHGLLCMFEVCP